ncbi:MAG: ribonuclease HII [Candidatus Paceibacterota bacterium]
MPKYLIGIDEAGRGPLAGPLSVAAVCVPVGVNILDICEGVTDSKKLSPERREEIYRVLENAQIKNSRPRSSDKAMQHRVLHRGGEVCMYAHTHVMPSTLDRWGMTKSLQVAVARVLGKLPVDPKEVRVLLDGSLKAPAEYENQETIIKGDCSESIIGAASIIAKVRRDQSMVRYAKQYPEYGFEQHKGYGTVVHRARIKKYGPCVIHRKRFIKRLIRDL